MRDSIDQKSRTSHIHTFKHTWTTGHLPERWILVSHLNQLRMVSRIPRLAGFAFDLLESAC